MQHLPADEEWWVILRSVYGPQSYTAQFHRGSNDASIIDPDPGSYLVSILSANGYACFLEIDLVERTRRWSFVPEGCRVTVDEFAYIVTPVDRKRGKKTAWYQELRAQDEQLLRALENAAKNER
jgi:hypothetical protein